MESKDRKRTREEEEEELEGTKKKAKTEDVEKSEVNEKNEDEDENGEEAEETEKAPLRELLRRTCWLPEVAPACAVPAGSSEGAQSPCESIDLELDLRPNLFISFLFEQMRPRDWRSRRLSSGSTTGPT